MEKKLEKLGFKNQKAGNPTIRDTLETIKGHLSKSEERALIHLGHGDPSSYPSFRTTPVAEQALMSTLCNGYSPAARRAVAEYLSDDLPYELSEEDVFVTGGGNQAIDIVLTVLARPGANILFPRPGYPLYGLHSAISRSVVSIFFLTKVGRLILMVYKLWQMITLLLCL